MRAFAKFIRPDNTLADEVFKLDGRSNINQQVRDCKRLAQPNHICFKIFKGDLNTHAEVLTMVKISENNWERVI